MILENKNFCSALCSLHYIKETREKFSSGCRRCMPVSGRKTLSSFCKDYLHPDDHTRGAKCNYYSESRARHQPWLVWDEEGGRMGGGGGGWGGGVSQI